MPIDRDCRAKVEQAILQWARREITPRQMTELMRAIYEAPDSGHVDAGCRRAAKSLGAFDFEDGTLNYNKRNWRRAQQYLAYLRSNIEPNKYRYEEWVIPWRRRLYRAYVGVVLVALLCCVIHYGWKGVLVWPVGAGLGWVQWVGNQWKPRRRGASAAYPFDTIGQRQAGLRLLNEEGGMPPFQESRAKTPLQILVMPVFILTSGLVLLAFVLLFSVMKGPFLLGPWTVFTGRRKVRVNHLPI